MWKLAIGSKDINKMPKENVLSILSHNNWNKPSMTTCIVKYENAYNDFDINLHFEIIGH
jgi:hypothetical protein